MLCLKKDNTGSTIETEVQQQLRQGRQALHHQTPPLRQQRRHNKMQTKATMLSLTIFLMTISVVASTQQLSPKLELFQQDEDERGMRHQRFLENIKVKPEKANKNKNKNKWWFSETPSAMPSSAPSKPKPTSQDAVEVEDLTPLQYKGEDIAHGMCEGDCDNDDQCAGELQCFFRSGWETVPGCKGTGIGGKDYCYDPYLADPGISRSPSSQPTGSPTVTNYPSTWSPSPSATWSPQPSSSPSISNAPTVSSKPTRSPSDTDPPTKSPAPSTSPTITVYPSTWSPSPSWEDTSALPTITAKPSTVNKPSSSPSTSAAPSPSASPSSTWSPSPSASSSSVTSRNSFDVEFSFAIQTAVDTPSPSPSSSWSPSPTPMEGGSEDVVGSDFDSTNPIARSSQTQPVVEGNSDAELLENVITIVSDIISGNTGYEVKSDAELRRRILLALQNSNRKLEDFVLQVDRKQSSVEELDTSGWSRAERSSLSDQGIIWYNANINYNVTSTGGDAESSGTEAGGGIVITPFDVMVIKGKVNEAMGNSIQDGTLAEKLSQYDDRIQAVSEEGEEEETTSVVFSGNGGVQVASAERGFDNLQPSFLEPIRIIGMSMFFVTLLATVGIIYVAKNRKHEKKVTQEWKAYLGSDDEIERMLSHGIVSPVEGSGVSGNAPSSSLVLKVFDKEERGYNNEDSMLMGGHQYTPEMGSPAMGVLPEEGVEVKVEKY